MSPDLAIPASPAALRNEGSGFLPLTAKAASFSGIGYARRNGVTLCMGQFQGGFALCTVRGGEFLDEAFRPPVDGVLTADGPRTAYLRVVAPQLGSVAVESRTDDGAVIDDDVSIPMTRLGRSSVFLGSFTAVPDGFAGSPPPGPLVHLAIGGGELTASEDSDPRARFQALAAAAEPLAAIDDLSPVKGRPLEIGFDGDKKIARYPDPNDLIDPDNTVAVWKSISGLAEPVCYRINTVPKVFGTLQVSNIPSERLAGLVAEIEVRDDFGRRLGGIDRVPLSGTDSAFRDLEISVTRPPGISTDSVGRDVVSYNYWIRVGARRKSRPFSRLDGASWHAIYWIFDEFDPEVAVPFESVWGVSYPGLFDKALQHACDPPSGQPGLVSIGDLLTRATKEVQAAILYHPGQTGAERHPLEMYPKPGGEPEKYYCVAHAMLLRGLFQTVGVQAQRKNIWSGTNGNGMGSSGDMHFYETKFQPIPWVVSADVGFRVQALEEDRVPADPHFKFHTVVQARGTCFDPTYGTSGFTSLNFLEASTVTEPYKIVPRDAPGLDPNANQHSRLGIGMPPQAEAIATDKECDHVEKMP